MDYGKKIAEARVRKNISQEELAERLFVSRDLVSKWETNRRRPDFQTLNRIAAEPNVTVEYFEDSAQALINELSACIPKNNSVCPEALPNLLNLFLKTLSGRDADVFIRRYYFCGTPSEIAQRYHMNDVYVRVVLSRTRKKLKSFLERSDKIEQ